MGVDSLKVSLESYQRKYEITQRREHTHAHVHAQTHTHTHGVGEPQGWNRNQQKKISESS